MASASVTVDKQLISSIGKGVLVFAAVTPTDTAHEVDRMAAKILRYKLWPDVAGTAQWKRSVVEMEGEVLCVSQFTLLANTAKGAKPDFHGAAGGDEARALYGRFVDQVLIGYQADHVKDGVFQAMMDVALVNDGPVTLQLEVNPAPPKMKSNREGGQAGDKAEPGGANT